MYFLLPGLLCQDETFLVDGFIGEAIALSLIQQMLSARYGLFTAQELTELVTAAPTGKVIKAAIDNPLIDTVSSRSLRLYLAKDLPLILSCDRSFWKKVEAARFVSSLQVTISQPQILLSAGTLSSKIIPVHKLPGTPGYVGGFIGAAVDLSGFTVVDIPTAIPEVNDIISQAETAGKFTTVHAQSHQLLNSINKTCLVTTTKQVFSRTTAIEIALKPGNITQANQSAPKNFAALDNVVVTSQQVKAGMGYCRFVSELSAHSKKTHKISPAFQVPTPLAMTEEIPR